ncbi:MAG: hypothetical protein WB691_03255, partial [Pseudolabrys sp.]
QYVSLSKVLEAINPIVTATVWYEQRPTVFCNLHEIRRTVETLLAARMRNQRHLSTISSPTSLLNVRVKADVC